MAGPSRERHIVPARESVGEGSKVTGVHITSRMGGKSVLLNASISPELFW